MSKEKMIILCAIIIIFIIIIGSILIYILNKYYNSDYINTEFENQVLYDQVSDVEILDNRNKYFVIEKIISSLTSYIQKINGDMQHYAVVLDESKAKETNVDIISNMLDSQYKEEMNITKQDVVNIAKKYNNYTYILDKIYVYDKSVDIDIFIVYAFLGDKEFNVMIKMDSKNETFSLFLDDYLKKYGYDEDARLEDINIQTISIPKNKYNGFKYINIEDEQMAKHYLTNYINIVKYKTKKAYELLDDEYKNKSFPRYNDFEEYVNKVKQQDIVFDSYEVRKTDDYILYICKDKQGSSYVFKAMGVVNYTVQLDDYTIQNAEIDDVYKNMNEEDKCKSNIKSIFQMINMKEYASIYEKINNTFKTNNFSTLQQFETYIKNTFFDYNIIGQIIIEEQGTNYVMNVSYKDGTNSEVETRNKIFVMRLSETAEFEISFEI